MSPLQWSNRDIK